MSIGLGKNYLVRVVKHFYGNLEDCIKFMEFNKPLDSSQWYELRPLPVIKKNEYVKCDQYSCDLLTDGKR